MNPKDVGRKKCAVCDSPRRPIKLVFDTKDPDVRLAFYFCTLSHLKASMGIMNWIGELSNALDREILA